MQPYVKRIYIIVKNSAVSFLTFALCFLHIMVGPSGHDAALAGLIITLFALGTMEALMCVVELKLLNAQTNTQAAVFDRNDSGCRPDKR